MKKMDQTTDNSSQNVSLIAKDISYIQKDIATINSSIKELSGVYATKLFVDDSAKGMDLRLTALEESSNLWRWLSPTLAAILGSILTFLIISYITQLQH